MHLCESVFSSNINEGLLYFSVGAFDLTVKFSKFMSGQLKSPANRICLLLFEFESFLSERSKLIKSSLFLCGI